MPQPSATPARTAVLLAGGRSLRMGRDKAFLPYQGRPLWRHQAETLHRCGVTRWWLSCRREQGLAEEATSWSAQHGMELRVILDPAGQGGGVLGALVRCLRANESGLLAMTVDMPLVNAALLEPLWPTPGVRTGCFWQSERGIEPFPGFYPSSLLPELEQAAALEKAPSLQSLLRDAVERGLARSLPLSAELARGLANWNRPEDVPARE